jgi:hypothetical protein
MYELSILIQGFPGRSTCHGGGGAPSPCCAGTAKPCSSTPGGGELSAGMGPPIPAASAAPPGSGHYGSFATFSDPDGNGWVLQEVKVRAPGR